MTSRVAQYAALVLQYCSSLRMNIRSAAETCRWRRLCSCLEKKAIICILQCFWRTSQISSTWRSRLVIIQNCTLSPVCHFVLSTREDKCTGRCTVATTHRYDSREKEKTDLTSTMGIPDRQHAASLERRLVRAVEQECNWTASMWVCLSVCLHARCNITCGSSTSLFTWFCFGIWSFSPSKTAYIPKAAQFTAPSVSHYHHQ